MNIITKFLTPNKYSRPQKQLKKVNSIAIHYVGNPGTTAIDNRNYFENLKNTKTTYASSHFIIGLEGEIIQCLPLNEWSYCTNERNFDTISIECCHPGSDGKFTRETYNSLVELCVFLCKKFDLDPIGNGIIRHYDVTKKVCPKWFVEHEYDYIRFKKEVELIMDDKNKPSKWAKETWDKAKELGIMDGTRPRDNITRQELAAFSIKLIDYLKQNQ